MDFVVDKQNNKISVTREFAAPLAKVWAAWTQSELLDQWWAPKPWKAITKEMDFKVGGHWLYTMAGPDGEGHNCKVEYQSVSNQKNLKMLNGFCDSKGNFTYDVPPSVWICKFTESKGKTIVNIEIEYDSLADLEKYIEMGFKEGFTAALGNLDEMFALKM